MSESRIAYVILHYNTEKDTFACVDSIRKRYNSKIVIVCNNSPNGSDEIVSDKYKNEDNIFVIESKENIGFARGNNLGIDYVRDNDYGDIVVCINNDILIGENFEEEILKSYQEKRWAVAGVDVVNPNGEHCNPRFEVYPTLEQVRQALKKIKGAIRRCSMFWGIGEYAFCVLKKVSSKLTKDNSANFKSKMIMTLHGCCIIFSPNYFDQYRGFCEDTYLYGEEIILSLLCEKRNLIMTYISTTSVLHNESGGTKAELDKLIKRHKFYYQNYYNSTEVLLKIVRENEMCKNE